MTLWRAVLACAVVGSTAEAGVARAGETKVSSSTSQQRVLSPEVYTLRFGLPLLGVMGERRPGGIEAFGVGFGVRFARIVETEVATHFWIHCNLKEQGAFPGSVSARAGVSAALSKEWRAPLLVDYTHGWADYCNGGESPAVGVNSIGDGVGLDATFGAFNVRFLPILGWGWYYEAGETAYPLDSHQGLRYSLTLEIGGSFRRSIGGPKPSPSTGTKNRNRTDPRWQWR